MAMLQRRFASSIYAVRRTLERMKEKRERILEDPVKYRQEQITKRLPEDFEDLTDEERQEILSELEETVTSFDPNDLRIEIVELEKLIRQAKVLESQEAEVKVRVCTSAAGQNLLGFVDGPGPDARATRIAMPLSGPLASPAAPECNKPGSM